MASATDSAKGASQTWQKWNVEIHISTKRKKETSEYKRQHTQKLAGLPLDCQKWHKQDNGHFLTVIIPRNVCLHTRWQTSTTLWITAQFGLKAVFWHWPHGRSSCRRRAPARFDLLSDDTQRESERLLGVSTLLHLEGSSSSVKIKAGICPHSEAFSSTTFHLEEGKRFYPLNSVCPPKCSRWTRMEGRKMFLT